MMRRCVKILLTIMLFQCGRGALAQEEAPATDPAAEVSRAIEAYVTNFNARNAKQLAELWSADAVYTDRTSGDEFVGRAAIEAEFQKVFDRDTVPVLTIQNESLDLISPHVVVARGTATATATATEAEPIQSSYSVVFVKQDGQWLIDNMSENELAVADPRHEALQQLEFMIGEWISEQDDVSIEFSCDWTENETYISSSFKVTSDGQVLSSGLQIIGWDPSTKQIRSWLFDSSGTFVSGNWASRDEKWIVQSVATLSDGGRGSFISVFRPQEDGSYTWEKMNQVLDGQLLPNEAETIVRRK